MDYIPEIITVSDARENLYRLIDETAKKGSRPVVIKGRRSEAVLVSRKKWNAIRENMNAMRETLYLQSIPGMVESIKKSAAEPLDEAIPYEDLDW